MKKKTARGSLTRTSFGVEVYPSVVFLIPSAVFDEKSKIPAKGLTITPEIPNNAPLQNPTVPSF